MPGGAAPVAYSLYGALPAGMTLTGSLLMYYLSLVIFLTAIIGIGMVVSSVVQTQQQAFLGMFLVTVPMSLLSGFTAPIDNMPRWLQIAAEANPQNHFTVIMEGLFLKGMSAGDVLRSCGPLLLIAAVTMTLAALMFRARVE